MKMRFASYDKAIKIKPVYYDAWFNRGVATGELRDEMKK
jgi:hypothetical protein